jgi:hypothetical protein
VTSLLLKNHFKTKTVLQELFKIVTISIIIGVAVHGYESSKIEKYRGRSQFN